jgi:obg-like ATPase 1
MILGRVKNHLKMGIVGLPNVGKSSLFNLLTKTEAKAENYPFCTIEPNTARVPLPDERFDWLCSLYEPKNRHPSSLEVVDIAGLVPGAHEGQGLGNAFLANISAVDGIYHVVRAFLDKNVTHTEGEVSPTRDLEIIANELRLKDLETVKKRRDPLVKKANADPSKRPELEIYAKIIEVLEEGRDIKEADWNAKEIVILNELLLLTSKPSVYLVNISEKDYKRQGNKWLKSIFQWVKEHSPDSKIIPFSITYEEAIFPLEGAERAAFLEENRAQSQLDKIIKTGFEALNLVNFFTAGEKEVRAWPLQKGQTAPSAAGVIHTDFERCFIKAEVMKYEELKELGSESAVKAAGKYRTQGKNYEVEDGDILLIKHNAKK